MDVFNKPEPALISRHTLKYINKMSKISGETLPSWGDNIKLFYKEYIQPNLLPLIIIVIISIYLMIKYMSKNKVKHKKRKHRRKLSQNNNHKITYDDMPPDEHFITTLPPLEDDNGEYDSEKSIFGLSDEYRELRNNGEYSNEMLKDLAIKRAYFKQLKQ